MDRLKNVVIGVDFSEFSQVALAQAKHVARWNQTDMHLIHVVDKLVVSDLQQAVKQPMDQVTEDVRRTTQQRIGELFAGDPLERRTEPPGVKTGEYAERRLRDVRRIELMVDVVVGTPYEEILKRVKEVNGDLLVMGSNGTSKPQRGLGELARKCARKAPCRVLIVRETHADPFKLVVACVDFSSVSAQVVQQAIRVAQQDKAALHVVHMFTPPWTVLHYRSPTSSSSPDFQKQYRENLDAELHKYLQDYQEDLEGLDCQCKLIESQRPADSIIEYVEEMGADLVVAGTRGRTGVKALLLGTQAERIVEHTPVSVLLIKPE